MEKDLILFHGSPVKLEVGEYLDPAYCGMWENARIYNPKTNKYDINALYFIKDFDTAMLYARREIYAPTDARGDTKYFIFDRPDYATYVYEAQIPVGQLCNIFGDQPTHFNGQLCVTNPVKIIRRHTFDIPSILNYYGQKEKLDVVARIIRHNNPNEPFIAPSSFGRRGGRGRLHFDAVPLLKDLALYTMPVPGIAPYSYKQR